jgi:hypothetical protein
LKKLIIQIIIKTFSNKNNLGVFTLKILKKIKKKIFNILLLDNKEYDEEYRNHYYNKYKKTREKENDMICNHLIMMEINNKNGSNPNSRESDNYYNQVWNYYENLPRYSRFSLKVVEQLLKNGIHFFGKLDWIIKRDKEFVLNLMKTHSKIYEYLDERLQRDEDIINQYLDFGPNNSLMHVMRSWYWFEYDKDLMLKAVKKGNENLEHISSYFNKDFEITSEAIKFDVNSFRYISPYFQKNPEELMKINFAQLICVFYFANKEEHHYKKFRNIFFNLVNNKNIDFYHWVEDQLLTQWDLIINDLTVKMETTNKRIDITFKQHLSYMITYWDIKNIEIFFEKSKSVKNDCLKNTFKNTLNTEIKRRQINSVEFLMDEKRVKQKTRKLKF